MPPLFDFTAEEISFIGPDLLKQLLPPHLQAESPVMEKINPFIDDILGGNGEEDIIDEDDEIGGGEEEE